MPLTRRTFTPQCSSNKVIVHIDTNENPERTGRRSHNDGSHLPADSPRLVDTRSARLWLPDKFAHGCKSVVGQQALFFLVDD